MSLGVRGVGEFLSSLDGSEIFEDRCGVCAGVFFFSPQTRSPETAATVLPAVFFLRASERSVSPKVNKGQKDLNSRGLCDFECGV